MRVLLTNDDGAESPGIHALAAALAQHGHDLVVAAPDGDQSGTSASLGRTSIDRHLDVRRVELPGAEGVEAYAVTATPGMCVVAGRLGAFGPPPEVVVSGVNVGLNIGRSILHSGTVGAALTAQNFGAKGLAVSLAVPLAELGGADAMPWPTACSVALDVLELLAEAPARTVLNLNVPAVEPHAVRGLKWAHLDAFGSVRSAIAQSDDGRLQFELVATERVAHPDSDRGIVDAGFASLTSIVGAVEAWPDPDVEVPDIVERTVAGAPVVHVPGPDRSRLSLRRHWDVRGHDD